MWVGWMKKRVMGGWLVKPLEVLVVEMVLVVEVLHMWLGGLVSRRVLLVSSSPVEQTTKII
ncbi:hypothetical protein L195_g057144, partial [Trifolium pratense]